MAPKPPSGSKSSSKSVKGKKSTSSARPSGVKKPSASGRRPPAKQQKTKPGVHNPAKPKKKKTRVYTDKELHLPALNTITPVGVQQPRGKKKGKIFVDDQESMMTILAMVNAEKEGQIESKMMKARALEEIREARRKEAEVRQERKQEKLEETKKSVKRVRHGKGKDAVVLNGYSGDKDEQTPPKKSRKRVSFA